jgi:hypothetical protein
VKNVLTVCQRTADLSEDVEQLIEKLRNKCFSLQIDKETDTNGIGHLIVYVQYVEGATINEYMLFCKPIKRRPTAEELVKIVDGFMKEESIKLSDCVGVCTDAASVMAGNKDGLEGLH